ncbi:MAG TPA: ABC transporter substrate-binding protein [Thermoanaerobacter sp.]|nr:ABC transporter substrate-binding protein [Thermoanaerobacter sp.]
MKRSLLAFIITICIILSITACSGGNGTQEGAGSNEDVIRIAHIGPLTGDGAPWGTAEINAINMFAEEINAKGGVIGKKLKIYSYDNRYDNVETTNAARKAINNDKVCAIIGTNGSSNSIALASVCEELKVPHIATTATNPQVTLKEDGSVRPYSFKVIISDPQQGSAIANFAINNLKAKTAAVLYEIGSDYSTGIKNAFVNSFTADGGDVVTIEAFKTGDVDFRAQLSKIKEKNPDIIFFPITYKEIALATSQARNLGIESTFLGGDSWLNTDLFTLAPEAVNGSYFVNSLNPNDPKLDDFKAKYKQKYNQEAGGEGGNCYFAWDAMLVLTTAIEKAQSTDPSEIRDALENVKDVDGLTGKTTINPVTHNPTKPVSIFKIELNPNNFKLITTVNPGDVK